MGAVFVCLWSATIAHGRLEMFCFSCVQLSVDSTSLAGRFFWLPRQARGPCGIGRSIVSPFLMPTRREVHAELSCTCPFVVNPWCCARVNSLQALVCPGKRGGARERKSIRNSRDARKRYKADGSGSTPDLNG